MKIVIAPDTFKQSLPADEVARAIEYGFRSHFPSIDYILAPMADGGEGTLECLIHNNSNAELQYAEVQDPLGKKHQAKYGIIKDQNTAIIEMCEASGLHLVPPKERKPLTASSFGTGELILAALNQGIRKFIITLGGSATCDAGVGALNALGVQFKDSLGKILPANAKSMSHIYSVDIDNLDPRLTESEFILAHDVDNHLLGLGGALMFCPQKGATPSHIEELHKGYEQFAVVVSEATQKNIGSLVGGGAAGGMCAGLYAFLNATLISGARMVIQATKLQEKIEGASLVITGEGQIDSQTVHGKVAISVAKLAKTLNVPVIAICGSLENGFEIVYHHGIDAVFSIAKGPISLEDSIHNTKALLIDCANNIARLLKLKVQL